MKLGPVWSQSCTYTLFTLFPVLVFSLVLLWKLRVSYDSDLAGLASNFNKVSGDLNKCVSLNMVLEGELKNKQGTVQKMSDERRRLENKKRGMAAAIKTVESRALNLTSKLLVKEVEAGILKEENRKLRETIDEMKEEMKVKEKEEKINQNIVKSSTLGDLSFGNTPVENKTRESKVDIIFHTKVKMTSEDNDYEDSSNSSVDPYEQHPSDTRHPSDKSQKGQKLKERVEENSDENQKKVAIVDK